MQEAGLSGPEPVAAGRPHALRLAAGIGGFRFRVVGHHPGGPAVPPNHQRQPEPAVELTASLRPVQGFVDQRAFGKGFADVDFAFSGHVHIRQIVGATVRQSGDSLALAPNGVNLPKPEGQVKRIRFERERNCNPRVRGK